MLKGIDISHWQKGIDLSKISCDFVICKATEGNNYFDPCFETYMKQAESLGKCLGFYHFARPENNNACAEALYFYQNTFDWYGKAIPVLDWESLGKWNVEWAEEWLDEIQALTGVKPIIYMSEAVVNQYNWSQVASKDYGLWVAKYRDMKIDKDYDMTYAGNKPKVKWWQSYALWQWTSKGRLSGYSKDLDCDVFYGSKEAWAKYTGASKFYIVQEGDTLTSISEQIGEPVDAIVQKNNLLKVGQILRL